MKRTASKLKLNKQTVRALAGVDLGRVAGGLPTSGDTCSGYSCGGTDSCQSCFVTDCCK